MNIEQINVSILNRQFTIGTPESERDTLLQAVDLLNQKILAIQSAGRNMETDKIVIMAALNLTHDLLKLMNENKVLAESEIERRITSLIEMCDKALTS
ncbi:cell division protein ZapA [Alysiella crassa]|uniref:Cell division protein ZapA n=1 Tax=Alysiella crassa TaxID=153491 RepID=A0A376BMM9_9NEIS|nr:cell division protein ZapA [Alysiella crassa]UOP06896.1 cell division protein ZapA [Alysiella crassa]SSY70979.1 Z ring-associated protein ZapA [Alysiella crassa]